VAQGPQKEALVEAAQTSKTSKTPSIQRAAWRSAEPKADAARQPEKKPAADSLTSCKSLRPSVALSSSVAEFGSASHLVALGLGARLACLAYTDDEPGTVEAYDTAVLRGTLRALEEIAGGPEEARRPLSTLLDEQLGYTADCLFSHQQGEVDTQGFIAHSSNGDIALVFRGTTNIVDWTTNVDTRMTECDFFETKQSATWFSSFSSCCGGPAAQPRAHHGFAAGLAVALPDIDAHLLPQLRSTSPKRVIVAGHSLGGALATGAFAYILEKFNFAASPHEVHLVTMGSPRFGDARFVAKVMTRVRQLKDLGKCSIQRVVHDEDAVPTVPPELLGFEHTGGLCRLVKDSAGRSKELEGAKAVEAPDLGTHLVTDHEPVRYLHSIDDFVQRSSEKTTDRAAKC